MRKKEYAARWMAEYEQILLERGHPPGKVDWNTANFLFNSDFTARQAADKYYEGHFKNGFWDVN